ncbi:MAG: hypothetical protein ACLFPQ_05275 [Candidatus Woesearchaeota archaeon]
MKKGSGLLLSLGIAGFAAGSFYLISEGANQYVRKQEEEIFDLVKEYQMGIYESYGLILDQIENRNYETARRMLELYMNSLEKSLYDNKKQDNLPPEIELPLEDQINI